MITLPTCSFKAVASAGAFGFAGRDEGHGLARLWKLPFRAAGLLDGDDFAFFTKTVTLEERAGNLRLHAPWRAVWPVGPDQLVNCVGLTNPGLPGWIKKYAPLCRKRVAQKTFLSIQPTTTYEAGFMANMIDETCVDFLKGIEVDVSCPNVNGVPIDLEVLTSIVKKVVACVRLPVGIKVGYQQDYVAMAKSLERYIQWVHAINAVPWGLVYPDSTSPLAGYGYQGGVSGKSIIRHSRAALDNLKESKVSVPIVSGGGIMSADEAHHRLDRGADAVAFGTLFLYRPWLPGRIARDLT